MMVRQKLTIVDVIGVVLIILGIAMTVLNFRAAHRPVADLQSFTIHEIAPRGAGSGI